MAKAGCGTLSDSPEKRMFQDVSVPSACNHKISRGTGGGPLGVDWLLKAADSRQYGRGEIKMDNFKKTSQ